MGTRSKPSWIAILTKPLCLMDTLMLSVWLRHHFADASGTRATLLSVFITEIKFFFVIVMQPPRAPVQAVPRDDLGAEEETDAVEDVAALMPKRPDAQW